MKTKLTIVVALLATLLGCGTLNPNATIILTSAIAKESVDVATVLYLQRNPDPRARAYFLTSKAILDGLIHDQNWNVEELREAIAGLPIKELKGSTGALLVGSGITIFDAASGAFIDISNSTPWVKALTYAVRDGLAEGLAAGPQQLKSVRQCTVPPRQK